MPEQERLGDTPGMQIDILPSALESYQLGLRRLQRRVTDNVARLELQELLRQAHVTWEWEEGKSVRVRRRDRTLRLDVEAELIVLARTHVRCIFARARADNRTGKSPTNSRKDGFATRPVYSAMEKIGAVRVTIDDPPRVSYRAVAVEDGAPAPPWGPLPEHARAALRQVERNKHVLRMLLDRGVRV